MATRTRTDTPRSRKAAARTPPPSAPADSLADDSARTPDAHLEASGHLPDLTGSTLERRALDSGLTSREARIAEEAYRRAEQRGFDAGHELDDWLAAEREVDRQLAEEAARRNSGH